MAGVNTTKKLGNVFIINKWKIYNLFKFKSTCDTSLSNDHILYLFEILTEHMQRGKMTTRMIHLICHSWHANLFLCKQNEIFQSLMTYCHIN